MKERELIGHLTSIISKLNDAENAYDWDTMQEEFFLLNQFLAKNEVVKIAFVGKETGKNQNIESPFALLQVIHLLSKFNGTDFDINENPIRTHVPNKKTGRPSTKVAKFISLAYPIIMELKSRFCWSNQKLVEEIPCLVKIDGLPCITFESEDAFKTMLSAERKRRVR